MAFQTSQVTIVSDNPLYPNNKVTLTVDNDLDPNHTIVVPNTSFPYIVQFTNCAEAVGKRYISDWLFNRLIEKYGSEKGRVYNTLQKEFCPYPYLTIDYDSIDKKIKEEQALFLTERGIKVTLLDYVGASIDSVNGISPINLLKWLDLPIIGSNGEPIKSFPILVSYKNKTDLSVNVDLVERKIKDFFATTYFTSISYPLSTTVDTDSKNEYDKYTNEAGTDYFDGEKSKQQKYTKISNRAKSKSLDAVLSGISNIKGSVLGALGLLSAASTIKGKLDALKNTTTLLQSVRRPNINFNKSLVTNKIKKAEQKPKKKKRLSGKKAKLPDQVPEIKNPAVEDLKAKAGNLKTAQEQKLAEVNAQRKALDDRLDKLKSYFDKTDAEIEASIRAEGYTGPLSIVRTPGKISIIRGN